MVIIGLILAVLLSLVSVVNARPAAAASPCGPPVTSVIACENTLPGDPPSDWQVSGAGDSTIQGFATSMSVNAGETENFKINTPAKSYHIDILRLGYYQGNGARKVVSGMLPTATLPQTQPACRNDTAPTGLIDCGNWAVSASWTVPSNAVSGLYIAHLVRNDTGGDSLIPFVVRNDASHSDILFQTSDETWEAYNTYGGNSLYQCTVNCPPGNPEAYKGADKVSYNRPWHSALDDNGASWFMYAEYPMIRFLEANGYDVSYMSGLDVATRGSLLLNHKVFLSTGHDEYWSGDQRANVLAARNAGVNLAFFSGNEVFWKTRWEPSIDGSNTAGRTLVTYKETHYDAPTDPQDPPTWTGTWMDPRFSPPADGGQPQNALTGQLFTVNAGTTDITVPAAYSKLRFWRNTRVASLASGQSTTLDAGTGTLGYEWDVDADNGFRPAGAHGHVVHDRCHRAALHRLREPDHHPEHHAPPDLVPCAERRPGVRRRDGAVVVGPGQRQSVRQHGYRHAAGHREPVRRHGRAARHADLRAHARHGIDRHDATHVHDHIAVAGRHPVGRFGRHHHRHGDRRRRRRGRGRRGLDRWRHDLASGNHDVRREHLCDVELFVGRPRKPDHHDRVPGGRRQRQPGKAGARDDGQRELPLLDLGNRRPPGGIDSGDPTSIEVGVKFKTDTFGIATGIRFYKASTNTGTHIGNLWTSSGQLLASATFTGETASGWQQVNFAQPVPLNPNTTYVASYFAPKGHYSQS